MQLIPVTDKTTAGQFLQVAVDLNKNDPNWIRPLDKDIEEVFGELLDESDNDTKFKLFKKIADFGSLQQNLSKNIINKILFSL